jgi:hypothetical protein
MTVRAIALLFLSATPALAQDGGKALKPKDAVPGPFRVFVVSDDRFPAGNPNGRAGKMHCYVCEAELNPTVAVFARVPPTTESPSVKVAAALNDLVEKNRAVRFGAFVAYLTLAKEYPEEEGRDDKAKAVRDVAAQVKLAGVPFGLAAGQSAATDLYGLKATDDLTVVFFDRTKVVKAWSFAADKPPTAGDIKTMTDEITATLKK